MTPVVSVGGEAGTRRPQQLPVSVVTTTWRATLRAFILMLLVPAAVVVLWQLKATQQTAVGTVPTPLQVVETLWHWIFGRPRSSLDLYAGTWGVQVWGSLQRVLVGYALAAIVGVALGLLIGANRTAYFLFDHVVQSLRTIPAPAWVPFSLIFFGLSTVAAVWLVFIVALFPIVVNTVGGVQRVPALLVNAGAMLGASPFYLWRRVLLPAAMPFIFVGLRLGIGMAWIAVVVSELVGVKSGLGYTLYESYYFNRMDVMIGTMLTLAVLGLLSDRFVGALSRAFSYES